MARVGFIGLGNMGIPMSGNLAKKGHEVLGFDLMPANVEAAAKRGVKGVKSAADAVAGADCVITMLPAGRHVVEVWGSGILKAAKAGTPFVDCSTIDIASAKAAHDLAKAAGMLSLDSPVSGGVGGAEAATLTLMVGGGKEAFEKARPYLDCVGKKVVHCGDAGAGQAAKVCNNMVLGISMIATSEAFCLAEKLGLSAKAMYDVCSTSSGQSWSLTGYCPAPELVPTSPANNGYKPGFSAALMQKDLALAQEAARGSGAPTPLGAEAAALFNLFVAQGNGGKDFSGIIEMIRNGKA